MAGSFGKEFRLLNSEDFDYLRKGAFCFNAPYFRFYFKVSLKPSVNGRIGLSVSRKVGKAHDRNFVRRSLKEQFRQSETLKTCGQDILIIASPRLGKLDRKQVFNEVVKTFNDFIDKHEKNFKTPSSFL